MTREELISVAKPILFNTDDVRAILDGRKTVTRRVVKPQPKMPLSYTFAGYRCGTWGYPSDDVWKYWGEKYRLPDELTEEDKKRCWTPPCNADDILYVRETWNTSCKNCELDCPASCNAPKYRYKADMTEETEDKWRPSIHMPKEAARIFLKVKNVRVERLQDITEEQALKEGIHYDESPYGYTWKQKTSMVDCYTSAVGAFRHLWYKMIKRDDIGIYDWDSNPWVWVIEFERIEPGKEHVC